MKQYHCFSLRQAGYLMTRGFVLFEIQDDKNSRRKIYMFKDSTELRVAVRDYTKSK
ncbi:DUF5659 domain-containing protein [Lederbergia citrisecunda]|uniref:DUF5659 domain-containing protein n=1 Tax=Lederbergia citrisecunda TaxID=2833583 RepID=UPI003D2B1C5E